MGQVQRIWFAIKVTVGMTVATIIHFRWGVNHLYPMAQTGGAFAGPFSPTANALETVVPIAIAVIVLSTWAWVLYSPIQQERTRTPRGPPR